MDFREKFFVDPGKKLKLGEINLAFKGQDETSRTSSITGAS